MKWIGFITFFLVTFLAMSLFAWRVRLPKSAGLFIAGLAALIVGSIVLAETVFGSSSLSDVFSLSDNLAPGAPAKLSIASSLVAFGLFLFAFGKRK